jgi:hypothetical protein
MRGACLVLLALLAACDGHNAAVPAAQSSVQFANVEFVLPEDPVSLPPGPGTDAVLANCTACHSPSTMLQQPKLSREKWEAQVEKMVSVYKAPIDPAAVPAIVDYLVAVQADLPDGA